METIDEDNNLRCVVLCAQGKSFCAGANFGSDGSSANEVKENNPTDKSSHLYVEAVRLFATKTPIVGVSGSTIGGLGLSLVPIFVACPGHDLPPILQDWAFTGLWIDAYFTGINRKSTSNFDVLY